MVRESEVRLSKACTGHQLVWAMNYTTSQSDNCNGFTKCARGICVGLDTNRTVWDKPDLPLSMINADVDC